MGKKHEPLVFEIIGGTGFVVMTRREDNTGRAYQGADGRTYRDNVRLEFTDEGNAQVIDVHRDGTHVADLLVREGDHDTTHPWLQTDTHLRLLPRSSYSLEFSGLVCVVTMK